MKLPANIARIWTEACSLNAELQEENARLVKIIAEMDLRLATTIRMLQEINEKYKK